MTAPQVPPQRSAGVDYTDPIADLMRPLPPGERLIVAGVNAGYVERHAAALGLDADAWVPVTSPEAVRRLADRDRVYVLVDAENKPAHRHVLARIVQALHAAGREPQR